MKYEYGLKTTVDKCIKENAMSTEWVTMEVEQKPMHKRKRSTKDVIGQRIFKPVQARKDMAK